jgi:sterol O-acyltransferase
MRGFFVLFWVSLTAKMLITMYENLRDTGSIISLELAQVMSFNGSTGLYSDLAMVISLFYVVLYQKLIQFRIIPLQIAGYLQHLLQVTWLFVFIRWAILQDWGWTLSGAFTMHVIAMLMKQHSYTSYNIELWRKLNRYNELNNAANDVKKVDTVELSSDQVEEMTELYTELNSGQKMFPANQTILNFIDYLAVPSLIYELHFPRTSRYILCNLDSDCGTFVKDFVLHF